MALSNNERLVMQFAQVLGHDIWDGWRVLCLNYPNRSPVLDQDGQRVCFDFRELLSNLNMVMHEAEHFLKARNIHQWMLVPSNNGYRFRVTHQEGMTVSGYGVTKQLAIMQACVKLHHHLLRREEDSTYVQPLYMD